MFKLVLIGTAACFALVAVSANAQPAAQKDIVGTWAFVSNTADLAGKQVELFGTDGKGRLTLGADGRYTIVIVRSGLPKFVSGSRMNGTPEENKAVIQGSNAHFGTYVVDEPAGVLIFRIEGATFPNWDGALQKRSFTLDGDVLKYIIPTSTTGSGAGEVTWKRLN